MREWMCMRCTVRPTESAPSRCMWQGLANCSVRVTKARKLTCEGCTWSFYPREILNPTHPHLTQETRNRRRRVERRGTAQRHNQQQDSKTMCNAHPIRTTCHEFGDPIAQTYCLLSVGCTCEKCRHNDQINLRRRPRSDTHCEEPDLAWL